MIARPRSLRRAFAALICLVALGAGPGRVAAGPLDPVLEALCGVLGPTIPCPGGGTVWNVPGHSPTIQGAIDLAADGDTVLVAPGVYNENLSISGKAITLASHYQTTGDPDTVSQTIVDGRDGSAVLHIASNPGKASTVTGFTFRNAEDGVKAAGTFHFIGNRVTDTSDGIDLASAKGVTIRSSTFDENSDDGIDFDGASSGLVEGNRIVSNDDDGIEIRLHDHSGPTLEITIQNNVIEANREDGIQLIDYDGLSSRTFRIQNNLIRGSSMVGLGMMAGGVTKENFSGASIPEPIFLYNNTFVDNPYSVTGGDNVTARNNIFTGSAQIALRNVDGSSTIQYSLFWNNAVNYQSSNVDPATSVFLDPMLDATYRLRAGSPAIDAGTNVGLPYSGTAPDLGAYERTV